MNVRKDKGWLLSLSAFLVAGLTLALVFEQPVIAGIFEQPSTPSACAAGNHLTRVTEDSAGVLTLVCVADTPSLNNSTSMIINHDAGGYTANCQACIYARYTGVLDGLTGFVTVADSSTLKPTGDFTFAWDAKINTKTANERMFMKATGGGTGVVCGVNGGNNAVRCTIFAIDLDVGVFDTAWHCYVLTRSGTTVSFYQDAATAVTGTQGNDQSTTTSLFIGSGSAVPANPFDGAFSDFVYYNRAFTSADRTQFCSQHTNIPTGSLNLWLSFNVKSSTAVVDMTGNGNTGTVSATGVTWAWDNASPFVFYSP